MPRSEDVDGAPRAGGHRPLWIMAAVTVVGLLVTATVSWTAHTTDRSNERRLLRVLSKQAANVISSAIDGIVAPLRTAVEIARATDGDPDRFTRFIADHIGPGQLFVSASLWRVGAAGFAPLASTGVAPQLDLTSAPARTFLRKATRSRTFAVTGITRGSEQRVGYALSGGAAPGYVVYAERAIPANRRVPVESTPAFADLHFASYLGATTASSALQTTDQPPQRLPLAGTTARESIPFGDTTLTLVTVPAGHLGGTLTRALPWIFLIGGGVLTALAALIAGQLVRRRDDAQADTRTIAALYNRLDGLFAQQRTISETLQRALLPKYNPTLPGLEIASRYVARERGAEIGGDWYSVIPVGTDRFAFVVGDVSGHGIDAAALMGRLRFTLRAYLLEGHPPGLALEMCSRDLDLVRDGHVATVLVGVGDLVTREVTLANAGHPNPLVISDGRGRFLETRVGRLLGVAPTSYATTTIAMDAGSTLVAFTDGLVERRGEDIMVGLGRLAAAVAPAERPLDDLLTGLLEAMAAEGSEDDIAILALRWHGGPGAVASDRVGVAEVPAG
jgi:serine phosphatase RsbU (regulator of sigma subunit)